MESNVYCIFSPKPTSMSYACAKEKKKVSLCEQQIFSHSLLTPFPFLNGNVCLQSFL